MKKYAVHQPHISAIFFAITLGSLVAFSLGCRPGKSDISNKDVFYYNQIGGLESLDPAFAKNLAIMWGVHMLYNTLLEVDTNLQLQPSLAQSHSISEDGLTYTFLLQPNVFFQDDACFPNGKGRKMTAQDVVFSFQRLIDPKTAAAGAWVFNGRVAGQQPFTAINDSTVQIRLAKPFGPFLQILSMPYCSIIAPEALRYYGAAFRRHPVGTGPFAFQAWDEGNELILKRNDRYWERDKNGTPLPYLHAVRVSFHETRAIEFLLFKEKKLDFINGIDGSMKDMILTKRGELKPDYAESFLLTKRPYLNTEYLGIQLDSALFVHKNPLLLRQVRQAIAYGIDRQKIITYFRNGIGTPAIYGFTPPLMPGMQGRAERYGYDPAKATSLVAAARHAYGGALPTLILSTPDAQVDVCNLVAQQLQEIGLNTKVEVVQPGLLRQMMSQGQTPFFKAQWIADYPDAETYLAFFYGPLPAPPNYTRYKDGWYDRLYQQAIATPNEETRFALYRKMDSIISVESPVIPLFYDQINHFTQLGTTGFSANPLNIIDLKYVRKP